MSLSVLLLYLRLFFIAFAVVQSVTYVAVSTLSLLGIFLVGSSQREFGRTNRRVCTLSWNHGQKGRQKTYLVWCGHPLSNLTASVFSKLLLPFLTIMRAAARNGSKGFFKCSSGRLFMGGFFIIIIITKLIALQGFNLRDSKGNERSIALLMIPLSCLC